jgi:hypothetical protein
MAQRRLASVAAHLYGGEAGAAGPAVLPDPRAAAVGLYKQPRLLTNQQMAEFLGTGFLVLPVDDVPGDSHRALHEDAEHAWLKSEGEGGAGLGNNVWPALPQLGDVLRSETVHGGIQSILGGGYVMSAHRHMHDSSRQGDQTYHKDTQRWPVLVHRPRSVYIFFVPAGATLEMGPTAIIPGS